MNARHMLVPILLIGLLPFTARAADKNLEFTSNFGLEDAGVLGPTGENAYFALIPGRFLHYRGDDDEGNKYEVRLTVLDEIEPMLYKIGSRKKLAITRVVEEREWVNGTLDEVSLNYYAIDLDTQNIFCFGEQVALYEDGEVVSNEGSWRADQAGARPGLFLPHLFLAGSRYVQEWAPAIAMDRAEVLELGIEIETPAGIFTNCVAIHESSPLDDDDDDDGPGNGDDDDDDDDDETIKVYAPGIGPVIDENLMLVDYGYVE